MIAMLEGTRTAREIATNSFEKREAMFSVNRIMMPPAKKVYSPCFNAAINPASSP